MASAAPQQAHLKFAGGSLAHSEPQLEVDVKALNAWPLPALTQATELCCRFLSDAQHVDIVAESDALASASGLKVKGTRSALRTLLWTLKGAVKYSLTPAQLREDLAALGLDETHAAACTDVWVKAGPRLGQLAADRMVQADSLLDAEWRFGVTVSTDDVARVGSTFLQMRLTIAGGAAASGSSSAAGAASSSTSAAPPATSLRSEHLELTIPQFYDLLAQLEKAQSYATYLGQSA